VPHGQSPQRHRRWAAGSAGVQGEEVVLSGGDVLEHLEVRGTHLYLMPATTAHQHRGAQAGHGGVQDGVTGLVLVCSTSWLSCRRATALVPYARVTLTIAGNGNTGPGRMNRSCIEARASTWCCHRPWAPTKVVAFA